MVPGHGCDNSACPLYCMGAWMPDPREFTPENLHSQLGKQDKNEHLSPLMRAHMVAIKTQDKPNFCPFGCTPQHLDEHGYCDHLIGFTEDKKGYEPFVLDTNEKSRTFGQRRVQVELRGPKHHRIKVLKKIRKTDKIVQITSSWRVYRDGPASIQQTKEAEPVVEQSVIEDDPEPEVKPVRGRNKKEPATV